PADHQPFGRIGIVQHRVGDGNEALCASLGVRRSHPCENAKQNCPETMRAVRIAFHVNLLISGKGLLLGILRRVYSVCKWGVGASPELPPSLEVRTREQVRLLILSRQSVRRPQLGPMV